MAELDPGWQHDESPFHSASRQIQARLGMGDKLAQIGQRTVRAFMPQQHRDFYPQLPFLMVGSVDATGQPWASIMCGQPGFLSAPTATALLINTQPLTGDPLAENLQLNAPLGVLGIELPTRRRNRLNGRVSALDERGFAIAVDQAFGNCPKYIQSRDSTFIASANQHPGLPIVSEQLDATTQAIIASGDTLFIATSCLIAPESERPWQGVDISHRGGRPGFVAINKDGSLTLPDYLGNFHFRTLGNIELEPRAGLLFVDFETGDILQVSGRGSIVWDGPRLAEHPGAQRLLDLQITQTRLLPGALPLRFTPPQYSPVLPV